MQDTVVEDGVVLENVICDKDVVITKEKKLIGDENLPVFVEKAARVQEATDLKILFCSSEVVPFAASGGLGDVAGSLPKALNVSGQDVRVILPLYGKIKEKYSEELKFVDNLVFTPLAYVLVAIASTTPFAYLL